VLLYKYLGTRTLYLAPKPTPFLYNEAYQDNPLLSTHMTSSHDWVVSFSVATSLFHRHSLGGTATFRLISIAFLSSHIRFL
jgi:hypothetical protein